MTFRNLLVTIAVIFAGGILVFSPARLDQRPTVAPLCDPAMTNLPCSLAAEPLWIVPAPIGDEEEI